MSRLRKALILEGKPMSKHVTQSKETQLSAMEWGRKVLHSGPLPTATLMHEDIAKRAYEIYVKRNCQQGQSELNWLQAEEELQSQENRLQAEYR